ncbi:hypothetical protein HMPREF1870_01332 [Bacteroidales bacterium KA00344]|nr:hypothetical protein HMPREF1870_01332 [Bacteroidales bacterium KA00344]
MNIQTHYSARTAYIGDGIIYVNFCFQSGCRLFLCAEIFDLGK